MDELKYEFRVETENFLRRVRKSVLNLQAEVSSEGNAETDKLEKKLLQSRIDKVNDILYYLGATKFYRIDKIAFRFVLSEGWLLEDERPKPTSVWFNAYVYQKGKFHDINATVLLIMQSLEKELL